MVVLRATNHGGMNCSKREFARNAKVQHEKEWHLGHRHKCSFSLGGGGGLRWFHMAQAGLELLYLMPPLLKC